MRTTEKVWRCPLANGGYDDTRIVSFVREEGDSELIWGLLRWRKNHQIHMLLVGLFDAGQKPTADAWIDEVRTRSICCGNATEDWGTVHVISDTGQEYTCRVGCFDLGPYIRLNPPSRA